jgi:hypothetical protein
MLEKLWYTKTIPQLALLGSKTVLDEVEELLVL